MTSEANHPREPWKAAAVAGFMNTSSLKDKPPLWPTGAREAFKVSALSLNSPGIPDRICARSQTQTSGLPSSCPAIPGAWVWLMSR